MSKSMVTICVEVDAYEVHRELVWRIVRYGDNEYELRFKDEKGRFRPTDSPHFASLQEAEAEIVTREEAAQKEAELLRNKSAAQSGLVHE